MPHILKNHALCAELDDQARLLSLVSADVCPDTNLIAEPATFGFRLALQLGDCKETMVLPADQAAPAIAGDDRSLTLTFNSLSAFDGQRHHILDITLRLAVTLADDGQLRFDAHLDNRSEARILDFAYPCVGKIRRLGGAAPALLLPEQAGLRHQAIGKLLGSRGKHYENGSNSIAAQHPYSASMSWMALTDDHRTLFLTSHDPNFFPTELRAQGEPGRDVITLILCRYLCLGPGDSLDVGQSLLDCYQGTWHRGAKAYADWMAAYRPAHTTPAWVRDMTGYFLVINKQQFGYEMWPYDTLPELYRHAQAHGCDTLGLFGWYHSGHDNQYPDLEVSPTLGGEQTLRDNIANVRRQGGNVTLYYQGHLIDETSNYYRHGEGQETAAKNIWGSPYVEFYSKSHQSDMMRDYSRKVFHVGCPSSHKWRRLMVERQNWLASLGPNGCLYDQIGGCPSYICFDERHHHDLNNPALAMTGGRQKLLNELQTNSKTAISPDFAFFSEHITDLYSAYLDACHGINACPSAPGASAAANADPETPRTINYPALFRFCFPDTVITVRNPAPHIAPRMANYALAYGLRPEMELRYQADCTDIRNDAYAEWRTYACQVAQLRTRYRDLLLRGTLQDDRLIAAVNPALIATCFVRDDAMAIVLWNDTAASQTLDGLRTQPGWTLTEYATIQETAASLPASLPAGAIAVAIFRRNG